MKNLTKEEPKNITLVLENVVGGWVDGLFRNLLYEL
jgi:hypothetical protein